MDNAARKSLDLKYSSSNHHANKDKFMPQGYYFHQGKNLLAQSERASPEQLMRHPQ